MNTIQKYDLENAAYQIVTTVDDEDSKGSTHYHVLCERELSNDELALFDEVFTDTIKIHQTGALRRAIQKVRDAGYIVDEA